MSLQVNKWPLEYHWDLRDPSALQQVSGIMSNLLQNITYLAEIEFIHMKGRIIPVSEQFIFLVKYIFMVRGSNTTYEQSYYSFSQFGLSYCEASNFKLLMLLLTLRSYCVETCLIQCFIHAQNELL